MDDAYRYHYRMLRSNSWSTAVLIVVGVLLNFVPLPSPDWINGLGMLLVLMGIFWLAFTGVNWIAGTTWLARQSVRAALPEPDSNHVLIESLADEPIERE